MAREVGAPAPSLVGEIKVDVAIVGGGYTGLWTALALKARKPGLSVAVIEASLCGSGASGKNGGKVHGYWASAAGHVAQSSATMARWPSPAPAPWRRMPSALSPPRRAAMSGGARPAICASPARRRRTPRSRAMWTPPAAWACRIRARIAHASRGRALLPLARVPGRRVPARRRQSSSRPCWRGLCARAVMEAGVEIYENTPMTGLDKGHAQPRPHAGRPDHRPRGGAGHQLRPGGPAGNKAACERLLQLCGDERARARSTWKRWAGLGEEGISDMRMFLHYFRKTPDGRVLMGSGSGPIASMAWRLQCALARGRRQRAHAPNAACADCCRHSRDVPIAKAWGGQIDVSADRLPFFKTIPGTRVHYRLRLFRAWRQSHLYRRPMPGFAGAE